MSVSFKPLCLFFCTPRILSTLFTDFKKNKNIFLFFQNSRKTTFSFQNKLSAGLGKQNFFFCHTMRTQEEQLELRLSNLTYYLINNSFHKPSSTLFSSSLRPFEYASMFCVLLFVSS